VLLAQLPTRPAAAAAGACCCSFFDTHTFYQVVVVVWGFLRGLTSLNIGMVAEWWVVGSAAHVLKLLSPLSLLLFL
jgi:hypothetical protein